MGGGTWKWVGDGVRQKLETVRVGSDWGRITNRADRKKKEVEERITSQYG